MHAGTAGACGPTAPSAYTSGCARGRSEAREVRYRFVCSRRRWDGLVCSHFLSLAEQTPAEHSPSPSPGIRPQSSSLTPRLERAVALVIPRTFAFSSDPSSSQDMVRTAGLHRLQLRCSCKHWLSIHLRLLQRSVLKRLHHGMFQQMLHGCSILHLLRIELANPMGLNAIQALTSLAAAGASIVRPTGRLQCSSLRLWVALSVFGTRTAATIHAAELP